MNNVLQCNYSTRFWLCMSSMGTLFRHILLIKDNCVFINPLQWHWMRHYVFDWFIRLIIIKVFCLICHWNSGYSSFIGSVHLFFISHKKAIYIYIYIHVFVLCCVLCLINTIQHILEILFFLNLALNPSPFCLLPYSFTDLPLHFRVKVLLLVKH